MEKLLEFIKTYENGVTEEQILIMNPNLNKESLVKILNKLIKNNTLTVYKNGPKIFYKAIINASDDYESLIINLISQSGTEGLWIKDIREKTNMPQNLILKMLSQLENKRIIKSMKNMKNNRKVYVLFDVIPSDEVTGGFWFNDNDVDVECVENVSKIVYNFIDKKTRIDEENAMNKYSNNPSLLEITEFINTLNFLNSKVKETELRTLLFTLVYDNKIEALNDQGTERFRVLK
ncbi:DNA-directed RNA polymerase III subunit RPC6 [Vairimorpha necatrix]|uniref:DNA-directed RNA polymerase III subunit RPC6 n=1 Tax=Vairimorpha necatrix TaxID=6039 RepID=A0AAX4JDW6_9MICR